jgi:hypothetical protein
VRNEGPGNLENPRVSPKRAFRQFWKLTVITWRKIGSDLTNLIFRKVKIVYQPLGGRRNESLLCNCGCDDTIGVKKGLIVVANPFCKWLPSLRLRADRLRSSQALGVLLEALDAEKLFADRFFAGPRWNR